MHDINEENIFFGVGTTKDYLQLNLAIKENIRSKCKVSIYSIKCLKKELIFA